MHKIAYDVTSRIPQTMNVNQNHGGKKNYVHCTSTANTAPFTAKHALCMKSEKKASRVAEASTAGGRKYQPQRSESNINHSTHSSSIKSFGRT